MKKVVGWREWIALPDLGVKRMKAKMDTGAKTSALHADHIRIHTLENGHHEVSFTIFPFSKNEKKSVRVTCPLKESRVIKSSTGTETLRPVISTTLKIGSLVKKIEITLINRAQMEYRMLLGRSALKDFFVDSRHSYLLTSRKGK
jgi:hypothetical protein